MERVVTDRRYAVTNDRGAFCPVWLFGIVSLEAEEMPRAETTQPTSDVVVVTGDVVVVTGEVVSGPSEGLPVVEGTLLHDWHAQMERLSKRLSSTHGRRKYDSPSPSRLVSLC